jgi:isoquinoline 1-oxidoreductase beta subunit
MVKLSRRTFLISGLAVGGGLFLGYALWPAHKLKLRAGEGESVLSAWLKIGEDGVITVVVPQAEMGQGVYTSLPMLLADELDADWEKVRVEAAPVDSVYTNTTLITSGIEEGEMLPKALESIGLAVVRKVVTLMGLQMTGGSTSVRNWYEPYRLAGAAALIDPPGEPKLKDPAEFNLIGKPVPRLDIPAKVDGSAEFGADIRLPGMSWAALSRAEGPVRPLVSYDASAAEAMPGVQAVVAGSDYVAVVADSYWRAKKAAAVVEAVFAENDSAAIDSAALAEQFTRALETGEAHEYVDEGDVDDVMEMLTRSDRPAEGASFGRIVEAEYAVPYLAHACMEPMNATAWVHDGACEIWLPTQGPSLVRDAAADLLGIDKDAVTVHTTLLGGGFGRRVEPDVALQAVEISRATGHPVQLIWSREEDIHHDSFRPMAMARMHGVLDADGLPMLLTSRSVCQSVTGSFSDRHMPAFSSHEPDPSSVEGLDSVPYAIANRRIEHVMQMSDIPVGYWRSVGHSFNAFFAESFIDELAAAAGADPLAYRRRLLRDEPRYLKMLDLLEEKAGPAPEGEGRGRGYAIHHSFGSIVAEAVDVTVNDGALGVDRVTCIVDCGDVVNPDTIDAQMESGIIFALTAALTGEVAFDAGAARQSNFHDYKMVKMAAAPIITTHIIRSGERLGGVGEPSTPPLAPALINAIYAATGRRIRTLPLDQQGFTLA